MKKNKESWPYPTGRIGFLWQNMDGKRAVFIIAIIGTLIYNVMQLTVPVVTGRLVSLFLTGEQAAQNMAEHRDVFWQLIIAMVGLTLLRVIIVYVDCMAFEHTSQHVIYRIRTTLYDKVQHQDMSFYAKYRTGDLMTRLTGDLDAVRHMIAWVVRMLVECVSLYTAAAVCFFVLDWRLALVTLSLTPLLFFVVYKFRLQIKPMHVMLREKFAGMNTDAQQNISGNRVVKAFAREGYEMEKFDKANSSFRDANEETQMTWLRFFPAIEGIANLLPVFLLVAGGLFIIADSLDVGAYVTFSGLIWAVCNPMRQLGGILNEFQRFSASAQKVMELWYAEPQIKDKPDAVDHTEPFKGKIEFRNVSFTYSDGTIPVLRNIAFTARPGETVAIMGETGCGKTTMINLIPRFFDPTEGSILLDDIDIRDLHLHELRKAIGLANQDVLLYSDTIEDNIAYGDTSLKLSQVQKYAEYSAAAQFITRMPQGYDTIIGERGVGLSGGQKQRISLARALAVRPAVLILDDTTSAVDMETEKLIQDAIGHLDFPCTKIMIAQRISTTRHADRILVLQDGRITEQGSHEELIAQKGYYYELVKLQTGLDEELEQMIRSLQAAKEV